MIKRLVELQDSADPREARAGRLLSGVNLPPVPPAPPRMRLPAVRLPVSLQTAGVAILTLVIAKFTSGCECKISIGIVNLELIA